MYNCYRTTHPDTPLPLNGGYTGCPPDGGVEDWMEDVYDNAYQSVTLMACDLMEEASDWLQEKQKETHLGLSPGQR